MSTSQPVPLKVLPFKDCVGAGFVGPNALSGKAMTACLDRLEASGLIARVARPSYRRSRAADLTAAGRKRIDKRSSCISRKYPVRGSACPTANAHGSRPC